MSWQRIGESSVDSGTVWIGDPAYLIAEDEWGQFVDGDTAMDTEGAMRKELGMWIGRFGGDGTYPVYVERDARGYVLAAMIRFDGQQP